VCGETSNGLATDPHLGRLGEREHEVLPLSKPQDRKLRTDANPRMK
jgi:hypothetical protein